MKNVIKTLLTIALIFTFSQNIFAYTDVTVEDGYDYTKFKDSNIELNIYNWGLNLANGEDDILDVNEAFTNLTGIKINYNTYETNEMMYSKIKSGGGNYDLIFPSDYMIARMIHENLLSPLNFDNIPNYKYIGEDYKNQPFDPKNQYSVPYMWGLVGICYNKTMVDEKDLEEGFNILFNPKYKGQILMVNNSRDAFGITSKALGMPINQTTMEEIEIIEEKLKEQTPLVQMYVMDEIFDKMEGEEAALGTYYIGDGLLMKEVNPNIEMYVPKDGTNFYVDSMCIPKDAQNKEAAEMYINFLNETEVALENCLYTSYSTPHTQAMQMLSDELKNSPLLYPSKEIMEKTEAFIMLDDDINKAMDEAWSQIRASEENNNIVIISLLVIILGVVIFLIIRIRKNKKIDY